MAKKIHLRLKRSLIGTTARQRDTVRCLGLKKINQEVVIEDNPANRGQVVCVQHLLEIKMKDGV